MCQQSKELKVFTSEDIIKNLIENVCANACILESVISSAILYYVKLRSKLAARHRDKSVAAYAIYETLNRLEVPRIVEEIEFFSGVRVKDIFKIESDLTLQTVLNEKPSQYVQRYCSMLEIGYLEQRLIEEAINNAPPVLCNLKCNCLVAVVIYLYCRDLKKKVTLKLICEVCCISATSVHRVMRTLKKINLCSFQCLRM